MEREFNIFENKRKKAQIGTTITWFVAFVVIIILMVAFILLGSFLAGKKIFSGFNSVELGEDKISGSLSSQRQLFYIVNSQIDGRKIGDLILDDLDANKGKIEDFSNVFLDSAVNEDECYEFSGDDGESDFVFADRWKVNLENRQQTQSYVERAGSRITLFSHDKKVNLFLYFGKCRI